MDCHTLLASHLPCVTSPLRQKTLPLPLQVNYNPAAVPRSSIANIMGIFNAMTTIFFAYGGHNVALEIQATIGMTEKNPFTVRPMMRGVNRTFLITGWGGVWGGGAEQDHMCGQGGADATVRVVLLRNLQVLTFFQQAVGEFERKDGRAFLYKKQKCCLQPSLLLSCSPAAADLVCAGTCADSAKFVSALAPLRLLRLLLHPGLCYIGVSILGFWAFGTSVKDNVLFAFKAGPHKWVVTMATMLVVVHVAAAFQVRAG